MMEWLAALVGLAEPAVVVTVAAADGSTPREAGAKMVVTEARIFGTIGGGNLEFRAIDLARAMLATTASPTVTTERLALGPSLGQCCGGSARLVLERFGRVKPDWIHETAARRSAGEVLVLATPIGVELSSRVIGRRDAGCVAGVDGAPAWLRDAARELIESAQGSAILVERQGGYVLLDRLAPVDFHVVLFGAGHVGQAIARVLGTLPCTVTWIDDREDQYPAALPSNVAVEWSDTPALEVDRAPPGSAFLVMTHSHALDQDICERILRRDDYAYFGLIGSGTKRASFERRLRERGIDPAKFAKLTCPIGIPGIRGKEPAVIAVAVAAQLLEMREALSTAAGRSKPKDRLSVG